jgi:tRNA nucleotidyltransferase (CCA-adding enzyme)
MADYIYLLQTRLTAAQQKALATVRDVARARNLTVFLVGGAVRDLTSGAPIRDLDVVVQGSAPKLRKDLEKADGLLVGESETFQSLFFHFPGGVRMEVGSALSVTYPKPGKPVAKAATILDDLRRRDFTANAMAISLNEGSYGLLMDPMNGVADIENRELRLVSNYGFIEDPSRMVRAARFGARLGWHMEARTQARYDTGKEENYIAALNPAQRGYETEEIIREEDPLRVLRRLESEGWMKHLFPAWNASKANEAELNRLRDTVGQLNSMGIYPDPSVAYFPLLTAKLAPKDVDTLKKSFARPGFAAQIESLEGETKAFGVQFSAKENAAPSAAWKLLGSAVPESVLWLAHSTKSAPVQARFKAFFGEWPQARQRIPYTLMQEMRINPDLPGYDELVEKIFFAIMDGKLDTPEAAKAFLEPFSPPAPPPPVNMRRRAAKRETKPAKSRAKKAVAAVEDDEAATELVAEAPAKVAAPKAEKAVKAAPSAAAKPATKAPATPAPAKPAVKAVEATKKAAKPAPAAKTKPVAAKAAAKKAPAKVAAKPVAKAKPVSKPVAKKAPTKVQKVVAKPKVVAKKAPAKVVAKKAVPAKKAPAPAKKSKPQSKAKR